MKIFKCMGFIAIFSLISCFAIADPKSSEIHFPKIWNAIAENSPELKAKRFSKEAAESAKNRLSLHWVPKLHAESKAYGTDDPTANFINVLGERQATTQDFNPSQLNTPGTHTFTLTTAGVDLPIFEGGSSQAALTAQENVFEAKEADSKAAADKVTLRLYGYLRTSFR